MMQINEKLKVEAICKVVLIIKTKYSNIPSMKFKTDIFLNDLIYHFI